jgi:ribosome-associated toxin RatA of RatAB toxin-antitoxin module
MAKADLKKTLSVDSDAFFETITKYEEYPQFIDGLTQARVDRAETGLTVVHYKLNMMGKDLEYVLEHKADASSKKMEWTLIESDVFKKNSGFWHVKPSGNGKCEIEYEVEVEFKMMVPGFLLKRLVSGSLPAMIKSFEDRAKSSQK